MTKIMAGRKRAARERALLVFLFLLAPGISGARAQEPAAPAETTPPLSSHNVPGIKNFGEVTPRLYRGAQPSEKGYDLLAKMGVQIVIDLREEKDLIERERQALESRHIQFVSIPWSPWHDPTTAQVQLFFEALRASPDKRMFVHCEVGADRTGTLVALYRIASQQWKVSDAVHEMHAYHYHAFLFGHLAHYVENFQTLLASNETLRTAIPGPPAPPKTEPAAEPRPGQPPSLPPGPTTPNPTPNPTPTPPPNPPTGV